MGGGGIPFGNAPHPRCRPMGPGLAGVIVVPVAMGPMPMADIYMQVQDVVGVPHYTVFFNIQCCKFNVLKTVF